MAVKSKTRCPRCDRPTLKEFLLRTGHCKPCDLQFSTEPRILDGAERELAIRRHLEWLAGRLPSAIYRAERAARPTLAMEQFVSDHARELCKWSRTRPDAAEIIESNRTRPAALRASEGG